MSDEQKARENEVFDQDLSIEDLDAAAGGDCGTFARALGNGERDSDEDNCVKDHFRNIYGGGGFPNCAATVGDGSQCDANDACWSSAVAYRGMVGGCTLNDCKKAWR